MANEKLRLNQDSLDFLNDVVLKFDEPNFYFPTEADLAQVMLEARKTQVDIFRSPEIPADTERGYTRYVLSKGRTNLELLQSESNGIIYFSEDPSLKFDLSNLFHAAVIMPLDIMEYELPWDHVIESTTVSLFKGNEFQTFPLKSRSEKDFVKFALTVNKDEFTSAAFRVDLPHDRFFEMFVDNVVTGINPRVGFANQTFGNIESEMMEYLLTLHANPAGSVNPPEIYADPFAMAINNLRIINQRKFT